MSTENEASGKVSAISMASLIVASLVLLTAVPAGISAQGTPEFTAAANGLPTSGDFSFVTMADMDKDGNMDIISGADAYQGTPDTFGIHVWVGNGAGSWTKRTNGLPTTENYGGIGVGDLDKDGDLDIAAGYETWSGSDGNGVGVWLGNGGAGGTLSFTEGPALIDSGGYDSTIIVDVDADGNMDVVAGSRGKGIKVWRGNGGAGGLQWTEASSGLPTSGEYTGVAAADIDEDGDLDIAAGNYQGNGVQVWTRNSDGSWTEASTGLWDRDNSFSVNFADIDKDGNLDLAASVRERGIIVWLGNGGAGGTVEWTESRQGLPSSGRYKQLDIADFDNDGNLDIVAARPAGGIYLWRGNGGSGGTLMFTDASGNLPTDGTFYGAHFGKVNKDNVLDIVGATWDGGVKAWTTALGPADTTPPDAVADLAAQEQGHDRVRLTWTASGDDASTGTASQYDIRYSSSAISGMTDFESAFKIDGEPTPAAAGQTETFTVTGLSGNRTYYFAVVVYDEELNPSGLSNVASAMTRATPSAPNPPTVDIQDPPEGTTIKGSVTITFVFADADNDVNELEVYLDGTKVESRTGITSPQTWEWDTKKGDHKVGNGDHVIKVTVIDGGGHSASDEATYKVKNKKASEPSPGFEAMVLLVAVMVAVSVGIGRGGRPKV